MRRNLLELEVRRKLPGVRSGPVVLLTYIGVQDPMLVEMGISSSVGGGYSGGPPGMSVRRGDGVLGWWVSWDLDPGCRIMDPGFQVLEPGSRIQAPGTRIQDPDLGSRLLDPGSRIQDPGSRILDLGS